MRRKACAPFGIFTLLVSNCVTTWDLWASTESSKEKDFGKCVWTITSMQAVSIPFLAPEISVYSSWFPTVFTPCPGIYSHYVLLNNDSETSWRHEMFSWSKDCSGFPGWSFYCTSWGKDGASLSAPNRLPPGPHTPVTPFSLYSYWLSKWISPQLSAVQLGQSPIVELF